MRQLPKPLAQYIQDHSINITFGELEKDLIELETFTAAYQALEKKLFSVLLKNQPDRLLIAALAYEFFAKGKFHFTHAEVVEFLGKMGYQEEIIVLSIAIKRGLIKEGEQQQYQFIDSTIQQYYVAIYIANTLEDSVTNANNISADRQSLQDQVLKQKLNSTWQRVWWFVAGLLQDNQRAYKHYMGLLQGKVGKESIAFNPDLLGQYELGLLSKCCDEARGEARFRDTMEKRLQQTVAQWVNLIKMHEELRTFLVPDDYIPMFIQGLRLSLSWQKQSGEYDLFCRVNLPRNNTNTLPRSATVQRSPGAPFEVNRLVGSLSDRKSYVRESAAEALERLGLTAATLKVLAGLTRLLGDKEVSVRYSAAAALGKLGPTAATPEVVAGLTRLLSDKEKDVRSSAAEALERLGHAAAPEVLLYAIDVFRKEDIQLSSHRPFPSLAQVMSISVLMDNGLTALRTILTETASIETKNEQMQRITLLFIVLFYSNARLQIQWDSINKNYCLLAFDNQSEFQTALTPEEARFLRRLLPRFMASFLDNKFSDIDIQAEMQSWPTLENDACLADMGHQPKSTMTVSSTAKTDNTSMPLGIHASFVIAPSELAYDEKDEIGQGAFGKVFLGKYQLTPVAIKKVIGGTLTDQSLASFKKEAEIMATFHSPYIVQLIGVCVEPRHTALVMEYCPKGSLFSLLHSGETLDWPVRYQWSVDIALGLHYLHGKKIVHRDLKSPNVLVMKDNGVKLTDFGLAKVKKEIQSKSTMSNSAAGTLLWMAPELLDYPPADYSVQTDMYSYGITLFEILSRELPFKEAPNPNVASLWAQKGKRPNPTIPGAPKTMSALMQACWKDRKEGIRPTAEEVVKRLEEEKPNEMNTSGTLSYSSSDLPSSFIGNFGSQKK